MSTSKLLIAGLAIGTLSLLGCQSAAERQAAELREGLRQKSHEIEALNSRVIEDYQAYLQETEAAGRPTMVAVVRRQLETAQADLPSELDDLRQKIEDYPSLELPVLSQEIASVLERRKIDIQDVARQRQQALRAVELSEHWGRVGKSMRESIRREAQEGPAWLRNKPRKASEK